MSRSQQYKWNVGGVRYMDISNGEIRNRNIIIANATAAHEVLLHFCV